MSDQGTLIIGAGAGLILFLLGASLGKKSESIYKQSRSPLYDPMSPRTSDYERWITSGSPRTFETRFDRDDATPTRLSLTNEAYTPRGGKRKTKRTKRT